MYCKNCGKELLFETASCKNCGYESGKGDHFCQHCGKAVQPGQNICLSCGFFLTPVQETASRTNRESKPKYIDYKSNVSKINILTLLMQIITITLSLALIFLPIYESEYEPQSLDEIENFEEFGEVLDTGVITKNFSLYDDIKIIAKNFFTNSTSLESYFQFFIFDLFAIFELIYAIIISIITIPKIFRTLDDIKNTDKSTMLMFTEITKSGTQRKKEGFLEKQTVIAVVLFAFFDILYTKIFSSIFMNDLFSDIFGFSVNIRNMTYLSGLSDSVMIIVILTIGFCIIRSLKTNEEKNLLIDITKEDYM